MKKCLMGLILAALIFTSSWSVLAKPGGFSKGGPGGPGGPGNGPGWKQDNRLRDDARQVLFRTANVLKFAQDAANRSRYDRRGLGQAFAQQRYAQDQYHKGNYRDVIFHSLRARELAMEILRRNHGLIQRDWEFNESERRYRHEAPSDNDLDIGIRGFFMGDDAAVRFKIEFNF